VGFFPGLAAKRVNPYRRVKRRYINSIPIKLNADSTYYSNTLITSSIKLGRGSKIQFFQQFVIASLLVSMWL